MNPSPAPSRSRFSRPVSAHRKLPAASDLLRRLLIILILPAIVHAATPLRPERLRCEYLDNPIGLDEPLPRLSWLLHATGRGARQTAFQIIVASSIERLHADQGDLWDTGKVASSETVALIYRGRPLRSGQRVWWKVRVWDQDDRASAWSSDALWEMALLSADEWHGTWIGKNDDTGEQPLPLLRRSFILDGPIERARVYVTGLGYYELHLNGRRVGDHLLAPGYTRYDRRVLYSTYDVTDQLQQGENALGAMLGNGWFNVQTATAWDFDHAPWRASPRLRLELRVEFADGRRQIVTSDDRWKVTDGPITFSSIYGGETYDARREQPGWDTPAFDDSHWQPARILAAPRGRLVAQAMPPIKLDHVLAPIAVHEPCPGTYVFDFGRNLAGVAEIALQGPRGAEVSLKYGEQLASDGMVDRKAIGVYVWRKGKDQSFQTDTYVLKGGAPESWHARFVYHGFRYVEVTGAPEPLGLDALRARFLHTATTSVGWFASSNPVLDQIWQNTRSSYLNNLYGIFTDCPQREKNGWTGDAQLACEAGLLNFDTIPVYEKWLDDIADEQRPSGELPGIVPTPGWGYTRDCGPAYDSAFLLIPYYLYLYYGDSRSLRRHYEAHRRYLDYLTADKAKGGIVENGIGDWMPWKTTTPQALTSTSYYYVDALIVADTARLLGHTDDEARYRQLASDIRRAFNNRFFDPATGSYANGSQTALSCPLYQGLVDPAERPRVVANLLDAVERADVHIDTGILGSKYLLRALTDAGYAATACRIAAQETIPGWGYWAAQGGTTLWENWNGQGSQNHVMFGDVAAWFVQALAGIAPDPASPGFKRVRIRPNPVADLRFAKAHYDSVRGRIASGWAIENGTFRLDVALPANTEGIVTLPTDAAANVRESGSPLAEAAGLRLLETVDGRVTIRVEPGEYHFTITR